MIAMVLLGCWREAPPPPPPSLEERAAALELSVRRAGRGDDAACAALSAAVALAPVWSGETGPLGLTRRGEGWEPDWRELSLAAGTGPLSTALVTVGGAGIAVGPSGCVDPVRLDRWLLRSKTLDATPDCARAALLEAFDARIRQSLDAPCLCAQPASDPTPRSADALAALGLAETAARVRAWPSTPAWVVCAPPEQ